MLMASMLHWPGRGAGMPNALVCTLCVRVRVMISAMPNSYAPGSNVVHISRWVVKSIGCGGSLDLWS